MERRNAGRVGTKRRSAAEWRRIVGELDRSGDSVASFAASRELNANTVSWWRYELRRRGATADFQSKVDAPRPCFVELVPAAGTLCPSTFEVVLPSGVVIRATSDVDPEVFARRVAALVRIC